MIRWEFNRWWHKINITKKWDQMNLLSTNKADNCDDQFATNGWNFGNFVWPKGAICCFKSGANKTTYPVLNLSTFLAQILLCNCADSTDEWHSPKKGEWKGKEDEDDNDKVLPGDKDKVLRWQQFSRLKGHHSYEVRRESNLCGFIQAYSGSSPFCLSHHHSFLADGGRRKVAGPWPWTDR